MAEPRRHPESDIRRLKELFDTSEIDLNKAIAGYIMTMKSKYAHIIPHNVKSALDKWIKETVQDYKVLFQVNSVDFDDSASETESSSGQGSSPANDDDSAEAGSPDFADNLDEAGLPDSSDDLANVGSPEPADEESQDVASENSSSPKEKRRLTVVNAAAERYINRLDKRIRKFLINSANEETALFSTHAHKKNELRKLILYADLTPEEMKPYISP